jgi:hypothetical protein
VVAYEAVAAMHNGLGLTDPMPERVTSFYDRPFKVIAHRGFSDALLGQLQDPEVKEIAARRPIGSIDQFSDSTDLLSDPVWRPVLRRLYA